MYGRFFLRNAASLANLVAELQYDDKDSQDDSSDSETNKSVDQPDLVQGRRNDRVPIPIIPIPSIDMPEVLQDTPVQLTITLPGGVTSQIMWHQDLVLRSFIERLCKAHGVDFKKYVVTDKFGERIDIDKPLNYVSSGAIYLQESTAIVKRKLLSKAGRTSNISDKIFRNKEAEAEAQKELEIVLSSKEKDKEKTKEKNKDKDRDKEKNKEKNKKVYEYQYIFGITIEEAAENEKSIPKFLQQAMDRLVEEATKSPNSFNCLTIFPKNLNEVPNLEIIKNAFENGSLTISEVPDLRTVAALVINFFAELPERIFTKVLFKQISKANEINNMYWRICIMHTLLLRLPTLHREILKLMSHSTATLAATDPNRSTILQHLCRCLGPAIIMPIPVLKGDMPPLKGDIPIPSPIPVLKGDKEASSESSEKEDYGDNISGPRGKSKSPQPRTGAPIKSPRPSSVTSVRSPRGSMKSPRNSKMGLASSTVKPRNSIATSIPALRELSSRVPPLPPILQPLSTERSYKKTVPLKMDLPLSARGTKPVPLTFSSPSIHRLPLSPRTSVQKTPRRDPGDVTSRPSINRKKELRWIAKAVALMETLVLYREKLFEWQSANLKMSIIEGHALIASATMDLLLTKIIDDNYLEQHFAEAFFVCHLYIVPADILFDKFLKLFNDSPPVEFQLEVRKRILILLKLWFLSAPVQDSLNPIKDKLSQFLSQEPCDEREAQLFNNIRKHLIHIDPDVEEYRPCPSKQVTQSEVNWDMESTIFSPDGSGIRKIVEHLALIDLDLYRGIPIRECLHKRWLKSDEAPGFHKMALQFNKLSLWVQSWILNQESSDDRLALLIIFLDVAMRCVRLQNYHSAMAFYTAFHSVALSRLQAWKDLPKKSLKQWADLQHLFDFEKNYYNYRKELSNGSLVIPVLGIISKDLFALEENNPTITSDGLINFHKFRMLYRLIKYLKQVQRFTLNYDKNEWMYMYLTNLQTPDEKELYALSLLVEPKELSSASAGGGKSFLISKAKSRKRRSMSTTTGEVNTAVTSAEMKRSPVKKRDRCQTETSVPAVISTLSHTRPRSPSHSISVTSRSSLPPLRMSSLRSFPSEGELTPKSQVVPRAQSADSKSLGSSLRSLKRATGRSGTVVTPAVVAVEERKIKIQLNPITIDVEQRNGETDPEHPPPEKESIPILYLKNRKNSDPRSFQKINFPEDHPSEDMDSDHSESHSGSHGMVEDVSSSLDDPKKGFRVMGKDTVGEKKKYLPKDEMGVFHTKTISLRRKS